MRKTLLLTLIFLLLSFGLMAAWLDNQKLILSQPDGLTFECLASGDEYHNWLHDQDGYTIMQDPDSGYYVYAEGSRGSIQPGKLIAGRDNPASRGIIPNLNISESEYRRLRNSRFPMPEMRDAPTTGTINNIVIFIRFSDETEYTDQNSLYNGWFNTATSNQKGYFLEASYNQLTVNTTFYPISSTSTVLSWQDSHPRSYFQPYNASTNTNGYQNDDQRRDREFTLLQNATNGVSSQIPSSLAIDSDNDGRVDNVVYIVKGSAGAWSSLLWPHRWAMYDRYVYINGKRVYDFNFQLQNFLTGSNVGVICHEFFHTLGAPDLYHYTDNGISPAGSWDLMDSNGNPPHHMLAYMKWKYGGWISSIPTISADQVYSLNALTSSTNNCYRINSPNSTSEYFIVEYRRDMGTYESSIPGSGLLVYRINTSAGDGNADGPPDEVYVYRPGGTTTVNGNISNAHFSLESSRTRISSETDPSPFLSDGSAGGLSLYNIGSANGETISFTKGIPPIVTIDFTVNPYSEGFDTASFPPDGWNNSIISGSYSFERVISGTYPSCSPQNGAGMIQYNSYNASSGSSAFISSPRINIQQVTGAAYKLSFYMYRDTGYANYADRIEVYLNSTPNLNGSPSLLTTVNRSTILAPAVSLTGWYAYSLNIPLTTPGFYYVIFKANSAYGNRMYLDGISLLKETVPEPAINPSPANLAGELGLDPGLSWQSGGGTVSGYKLYLGTDNPPTNIINGLNIGNHNSYTLSNLINNTRYFWKIIPYNNVGDALNSPVWSFITDLDNVYKKVDNGTLVNTTTTYPAPYGNWYWGAKHQMLIPASELLASGLVGAGYIDALAFEVQSPQAVNLVGFKIKLGLTTVSSLSTWISGLTTHSNQAGYIESNSWNVHQFDTPFYWDGVSNIVVETVFQNSSYTYNAIMLQDSTPGYTSTIWFRADAQGVEANTLISGTAQQRPNLAFRYVPIPEQVTDPIVDISVGAISLNWSESVGADYYEIYASDIPNPTDWGSPIAVVNTPYFNEPGGTRRFYRIVAINGVELLNGGGE